MIFLYIRPSFWTLVSGFSNDVHVISLPIWNVTVHGAETILAGKQRQSKDRRTTD